MRCLQRSLARSSGSGKIRSGAGTQFDPVVVKAFSNLLEQGKFDSIIKSAQDFQLSGAT
jgi:HD-GYP domain-containing protein (c-di-GMP phosphodiesterase class II)